MDLKTSFFKFYLIVQNITNSSTYVFKKFFIQILLFSFQFYLQQKLIIQGITFQILDSYKYGPKSYPLLLLKYFNENVFYLQNQCGGYFTIGFRWKRHHMLWEKILTKRYRLHYPQTCAKTDSIMTIVI